MTTLPALSEMTFEMALKELEKIVSELEDGRAPLDHSIAIFERGQALKAHCDQLLRDAEARIEKIMIDPKTKAVSTVPFEGPIS